MPSALPCHCLLQGALDSLAWAKRFAPASEDKDHECRGRGLRRRRYGREDGNMRITIKAEEFGQFEINIALADESNMDRAVRVIRGMVGETERHNGRGPRQSRRCCSWFFRPLGSTRSGRSKQFVSGARTPLGVPRPGHAAAVRGYSASGPVRTGGTVISPTGRSSSAWSRRARVVDQHSGDSSRNRSRGQKGRMWSTSSR